MLVRAAIWFLATYALLSCVGLFSAAAHDPDVPKPDPPDFWRYITLDDATTTSKCIGDPRTPLCAVETMNACFVRRDDHLCMLVRDEPPFEHIGPIPEARRLDEFRYRVISARRVGREDIPREFRSGDLAWHVGDVKILVEEEYCSPQTSQCGFFHGGGPYIVRKRGSKWKMVDWAQLNIDRKRWR
jgi:hypothetical protein